MADILNIGDYSETALLFHFWGRVGFVKYVSTYEFFFSGAWYPMGFPDQGPFDLNLVGTLNIM